jgi:hypothetical protein
MHGRGEDARAYICTERLGFAGVILLRVRGEPAADIRIVQYL